MVRHLRDYVHWASQLCFESVSLALSVFSLLYGVRVVVLDSFYSYPAEHVLWIERAMPVKQVAVLLVVVALVNIVSLYNYRRLALIISLYGLLSIWLLFSVSFLSISLVSLHSLITTWTATLYSWCIWRARGLIFPAS